MPDLEVRETGPRRWIAIRNHGSSGHFAAIVTVVIWAGSFLAIHDGVEVVSSLELAGARFGIVAAFAIAWLAVGPGPLPGMRHAPRIIACGLLGIAVYNALLGWGEERVGAATAGFVIAGQTVAARCLERSGPTGRLDPSLLLSSFLLLAGLAVMGLGQPKPSYIAGLAFCLFASGASGAYLVLQRPLVCEFGAVTSAASTMTVAAAFLVPCMPEGFAGMANSTGLFWSVAYLSLVAGVVAYCFWMRAIDRLGAVSASRWLLLMAPLAALFDWTRTPSNFQWPVLVGGVFCLFACLPSISRRRSRPDPHPHDLAR